MLPELTLILGGESSGKSAYAERLVETAAPHRLYLATAEARDAEMRKKIAAHQARRGDGWHTVETPMDVAPALISLGSGAGSAVLFDCATMWLSNHLLAETDLETEGRRLVSVLAGCAAPVVVVSNEVGAGGVQENALARRFGAAQGALNQLFAERAGLVVAVMAGLPLALKGSLPELLG